MTIKRDLKDRAEWHLKHHGLHVLDNKYVEDCHLCKQLATTRAIAKMQGLTEVKIESDAYCARRIAESLRDKEKKL